MLHNSAPHALVPSPPTIELVQPVLQRRAAQQHAAAAGQAVQRAVGKGGVVLEAVRLRGWGEQGGWVGGQVAADQCTNQVFRGQCTGRARRGAIPAGRQLCRVQEHVGGESQLTSSQMSRSQVPSALKRSAWMRNVS